MDYELSDLWRQLRHAGILPAANRYRTLKQLLEREPSFTLSRRDELGESSLSVAMQTALLASEEIGVRGAAAEALLLWATTGGSALQPALERALGAEVVNMLTALRKVAAIDMRGDVVRTENFRNLIVAQAADMKVVLMLIAHCVVRMRLAKDNSDTQAVRQLSTEAAYVYAPLAHKLGLYKLKSELEDLSLKYMEHDAYYGIKDALSATKKSRDAYIERFLAPLREMLDREGFHYHIKGRTKSIHSIWQKMKKQQCGFEGVYDLFAIRIILDAPREKEKEQCWKVFSLITDQYESNLKRLRDWLTVPKSNGYESLHITVLGPEEKWVEVQIRTERMDEVAEHGLAAHWRYKGVKASQGGVDAWLSALRTALETGNEAGLQSGLSSGSGSEVYVFTPKGDLFRLPPGGTVLDFAYLIHSAVGNHCVGGKVNGRGVSIRQQLESGDVVEILTSERQRPRPEWLQIVVSGHAKSKIRAAMRDQQAGSVTMGREILERKMRNKKMEWDESVFNQLVRRSGFKETGELYRALSDGRVDAGDLLDQYAEIERYEAGQAQRAATRSAEEYQGGGEAANTTEKAGGTAGSGGTDVLVIGENLKGVDFGLAHCCNPVYGDRVFGFVTVSGGIKIHRETCPNAAALRERFPYRVVPARWAGQRGGSYSITLRIVGNDDLGIVNNITSIIAKEQGITLRSINIDSNDGLFSGILSLSVSDQAGLTALQKKLRTVKGVKAVSRM